MKQIWAENLRDEKNISLVFVYENTFSRGAVLKLACNVPFRLTVNGEFIGYGPRRMAHGKAAVNEYSLSAYADKRVRIEVEAVSYRVTNFYIVNQAPFFAAEVLADGEIIADSFDFTAYRNLRKLQKVQRYSYTRGFIEAYDYNANLKQIKTNEQQVCALCECCAPYPAFRTLTAAELESGEVCKREDFAEYDDSYINRRNTPHFDRNEQEYRISLVCDSLAFKCGGNGCDVLNGTYRTYALDRNAAGFIAFEAEVCEQADLLIQFDEILMQGNINVYRTDCINAINYRLPIGRYSLTAFEPNCMRYIRFAALEGKIKISNVRLITYENGEVNAVCSSGDDDLDLMFNAAVNSFMPNAVDVLTDCPSRERAGWLCDSYFTARAEKALTNDNKVERNFLRAYLDYPFGTANIPPQVLPMCYPADHITQGRYIPNWCMWLVLEIESYLKRSGDCKLVAAYKNKVCSFLDYMLGFLNSDGLLENIDGWVFVEWSRANELTAGVNYPTNMLFSAALKAADRLYGIKNYAQTAAVADGAILRQSYDGRFFCDRALRQDGKLIVGREQTETCQYYAFTFGYASKMQTPELYRIMFEEISGYDAAESKYSALARSDSFIGLYLRLDYLCSTGEYGKLIRDLKKYFLFQARETKTFWEYKDTHGSCCHGFSSVIGEWILKAVGQL